MRFDGEEHSSDGLLSKLANFSIFVGFEKEIISLLRKMEARKECGVKALRGEEET